MRLMGGHEARSACRVATVTALITSTVSTLVSYCAPAFALMIPHHRGAVQMADEAWLKSDDPRLRLFASQVAHPQRRQIDILEAMRRASAAAP